MIVPFPVGISGEIDLFESDADVIEAAANQRTAYLQELAAGEQVELTQKLLNEITKARRCLLNADQKQAYDAQLQSQQAVVVVANQHRAEPRPEVPKWAEAVTTR